MNRSRVERPHCSVCFRGVFLCLARPFKVFPPLGLDLLGERLNGAGARAESDGSSDKRAGNEREKGRRISTRLLANGLRSHLANGCSLIETESNNTQTETSQRNAAERTHIHTQSELAVLIAD